MRWRSEPLASGKSSSRDKAGKGETGKEKREVWEPTFPVSRFPFPVVSLMTRVLLVPDLPLERWPSMDRYAHRLYDWLESTDPGFEVRLAAQIGALTRETKDGRRSGGYPRWWAQDVDPTSLVLPGPLRGPQRYVARYLFYPWWLKRDAKRARLVHILDHSYAHMVTRVHRSEEHTSELQSQSNLVCRLLLEK